MLPALILLALSGCPQTEPLPPEPTIETRWLPATPGERERALEDQLAGFSQTMWEVGYRYAELHQAVAEENVGYADYQLEHIAEAIELGILRRPARAANARVFLDREVPAVQEALDSGEAEGMQSGLERLATACETCHDAEDVAFIPVRPR